MPVPHIFAEGQPVDADKVNADFADVLTKITEAVAGSAGTLNTRIDGVQATAGDAATKANSSVQLSGNQTITGTKTFTGAIKVPTSTAAGSAIANAGQSLGGNGYIKFGNGFMIQWGGQNVSGGSGFITLNQPFADTNYKPSVVHQGSSNYPVSVSSASNSKTASKFTVITGSSSNMSTQWIAVGKWS